jgi:hypothetical protein
MKKISNRPLYLSLISIVLGLCFFGFFQSQETKSQAEKRNVFDSLYANGFEGKSENIKFFKQLPFISSVKVYDVSSIKVDAVFEHLKDAVPLYEYNVDKSRFVLSDPINSGTGDGKWFVDIERKSYHSISVFSLMVFGLLYWCFFTYWALRKVYEEKKLNIKWVLTLALFNFLGYFAYYLTSESDA